MKKRILLIVILLSSAAPNLWGQKIWVDEGVSITRLDTLIEGFEALRGAFLIENSSTYEVMNRILDVDAYDWVEGESTSKMLHVDQTDSSFTFDFFVRIPWLFIKKTGRVKVNVFSKGQTLFTRSEQIRDYEWDDAYDQVDFYSAQWKLQQQGPHVKVTYLGVYQDQKMIINLNGLIISRIRKRLNSTFQNLRKITTGRTSPATSLQWPANVSRSAPEAGGHGQ